MGYSTDFDGNWKLNKPLTVAQKNYLEAFNQTRRMQRDVTKLAKMPDPIREAVGLPLGIEGEFYVGAADAAGHRTMDESPDVIDHNTPPKTQPGLWCGWVPTSDGSGIHWDGGEKFYNYVKWIEYFIENFLKPWKLSLSGEVEWIGEDSSDRGIIVIKRNKVTTKKGRIVYED